MHRLAGHETLTHFALSLRLCVARCQRRLGRLEEAEYSFKVLAGAALFTRCLYFHPELPCLHFLEGTADAAMHTVLHAPQPLVLSRCIKAGLRRQSIPLSSAATKHELKDVM